MAREGSIPESKRRNLTRIFRQLGLTQLSIAKALDISPAAISRYLGEGDGRIDLRPEHIQKLIEVLQTRLAQCRLIKSLTQIELAARAAEWDESAIKAARSLSVDSAKELKVEIDDLLSQIGVGERGPIEPVFATPGGALFVGAANYVRRTADNEIDEILTVGRSPASIVVGPINGGTSSFLNRVYQRAQQMPDCWVRMVHLDAAFHDGATFTQLDLFRYVFRGIGLPNEVLADNHLDVEGMKGAFDVWAQDAWRNASRIVLIIDGLDLVFKIAGSVADPLALINWLTALRHEAALGKPPYSKLTLFTAFTGKTWSAAHASPFGSQAGELRLRKFSKAEVGQAFGQFGIESARYNIDEVYALFHGHPYLTQIFAWAVRKGSSAEEATQAALELQGRYETHWNRMRSEIRFLIGSNYDLDKLLTVVARTINRTRQQAESANRIWASYNHDLRVFGLIDGTSEAPTICKFYQNAIERGTRS
jgi:predicted transcriptional regulator